MYYQKSVFSSHQLLQIITWVLDLQEVLCSPALPPLLFNWSLKRYLQGVEMTLLDLDSAKNLFSFLGLDQLFTLEKRNVYFPSPKSSQMFDVQVKQAHTLRGTKL